MAEGALPLPLAIWLSPAFPVGSFAYSSGLEWAHEVGDVRTVDDLRDWLEVLLERGSVGNDAILLAEAFRAATLKDRAALSEVNALALALATSGERRLETASTGNAFLLAIEMSWPCSTLPLLSRNANSDFAYPVAVGLVAAGHNLALLATLDMFCLGFVSNLVSAAIRLGAIGQTDGQRVIAALLPTIQDAARNATTKSLDDIGTSVFRADLASLRHETQYSRLFRS